MKNKIQHLVSVSGGKDSTAVYLLALERGVEFRAVFADTGNEDARTYDFVNTLAAKTGGPPVEIVRADFSERLARKAAYVAKHWPQELQKEVPGNWSYHTRRKIADPPTPDPPADPYQYRIERDQGGYWLWTAARRALTPSEALDRTVSAICALRPRGSPYLDLCLWKGRFPSSQAQFCTEELKVEPIVNDVVFPMLRKGPVLQWIGIRAEESVRRSRQPRFNRADDGSMLWRPIFNWTVADVFALHKKHGLRPNPLYEAGFTRVGCFPCINCAKQEIKLTSELGPEHVARIGAWEREVSVTALRGRATFFSPKMGGYPNSIAEVAQWANAPMGASFNDVLFAGRSGGCSSDLGLCETTLAAPDALALFP